MLGHWGSRGACRSRNCFGSSERFPQAVGDEGLDPSADVYIIGLDDQLDRVAFGVEELSGPLTILSDGCISFAYLGSVRLAGITLQQAMLCTQQLLSRELLRNDLR